MNDEDNFSSTRRVMAIFYTMICVVMFFLVAVNIFAKSKSSEYIGINGKHSIEDKWVDYRGNQFDFNDNDEYKADTLGYVSAFYTFSDAIADGTSLCFRSKNTIVKVYIDSVCIYETDITDAPFYNNSPGTRWNFVNILENYAGKTIEFRIYKAYEDGRAKVDNISIGDKAAQIISIIKNKINGFIVSLLLFFVSILYIICNIMLNRNKKHRDFSLTYLAVFGLLCAVWCVIETNILQLFTSNLRLLQVIDNMMIVLGALPLILYMDTTFNIFKKKLMRYVAVADIAYIYLTTFLQITGILDYHQTLNGAIAAYAVVVVLIIVCTIKQPGRNRKRTDIIWQYMGVICLGICLTIDLVRYFSMDVLDRAYFIRIGLLLFIICFGAGNVYGLITVIKKGNSAEFISTLAYSDGLTGLANRTAYKEKIQKIVSDRTAELGIVMMDINNLKHVNDTFGHAYGDEMISNAASMMKSIYEKEGIVYRVGGDEFAVLIIGKNSEMRYCECNAKLLEVLRNFNNNEDNKYKIVIASGFGKCIGADDISIREAEKTADSNMYKNKYVLKRTQI